MRTHIRAGGAAGSGHFRMRFRMVRPSQGPAGPTTWNKKLRKARNRIQCRVVSVEKSISLDPRGGGVLFFMFINKRPLNDPIRHLSHSQEKFLRQDAKTSPRSAARAA